jgi:hypothetical protein
MSHQEYIVHILRERGGASSAGDLCDRVRSRIPNRQDFYQIMECLERECRVVKRRHRGGILYELPT